MQFGSSNTAVFFKMRVAGVLHIFQFETKQVLACSGTFYSTNFLISAFGLIHIFITLELFYIISILSFFEGRRNLCSSSDTHK